MFCHGWWLSLYDIIFCYNNRRYNEKQENLKEICEAKILEFSFPFSLIFRDHEYKKRKCDNPKKTMQDYKINRSSVDTNYIIGNVAMET